MIHELLLALSGFPGSVFAWSRRAGLQVLQDVPFIHPSEVNLLNRICRLGTDYIRFSEFVQQNSSHVQKPQTELAGHKQGMYLRAFCSGLDLVLQSYRQALLDLEQQFLADPHLSVSHVNHSLEQFQLLFPALMVVLDLIKSQKVHGCQILEVIYKHSCSGLPPIRKALEKVLWVCHGVMYKQISAWMLHGLLLDPHQEFFIQQGGATRPEQGALATPTHSQSEQDDELGIGGVSGRQLRQMQNLHLSKEAVVLKESMRLYSIRPEMLPGYLPHRLAQKVLFVGESVQMFQSQAASRCASGSLLKSHEDAFATEIHNLQQQDLFSLLELEMVVDKIRNKVAEHLWKLVVEEADLLGQLKTIKDFYLLGRGELFQAFIDSTQTLLKAPPTAVTEHDVNVALQQAASRVLLDDEHQLHLFHLTISAQARDHREGLSGHEGEAVREPWSGWAALGLSYTVRWPLHILLTPSVLDKYNVMFRYLLEVRRVQAELQRCWAVQMERKSSRMDKSDAVKWRLRNHMAFLVDNLQYYLQVDVLESQFSQLQQQVSSKRDFESIRLAHDAFLANLLATSFILLKPVFHCLHEILGLCHSFSALVTQASPVSDDRVSTQLDSLVKGFSRQSSLLFKILSSVRSQQSNPNLAQLLLRLDYNKYYTLAGGTLGSFGI
ncbi:gamma-tubulin complex component 4 isoform X1 [Lampetra planeri]